MARWKLTEPHYLNVPGTEWEQVTTDRVTQRPVRKKYRVPLHLDPRIESDWTHDSEGDKPVRAGDMDGSIMVCYEGKGKRGDITFEGDPSPGMLPMDDEAEEISARFSWTPTPEVDYGFGNEIASVQANILNGLIAKLADATVKGPSSPAPAGFDKFMEAMAVMMAQQNQILQQLLVKQEKVEAVTEPELPLEEPEIAKDEIVETAVKAQANDHASRLKAQANATRRV